MDCTAEEKIIIYFLTHLYGLAASPSRKRINVSLILKTETILQVCCGKKIEHVFTTGV
jgi:hypothetical protein